MTHTDGYTREHYPSLTYGNTGMPRGPLGHVESPFPVAIGFCRLCGANARGTTTVRGVFNCPECVHAWFDSRVGQQPRSFEDFFEKA